MASTAELYRCKSIFGSGLDPGVLRKALWEMTSSMTFTRKGLSTMAQDNELNPSKNKVLKNHIQDVIEEDSEDKIEE